MQDELKNLADVLYPKVIGPKTKIDIAWIRRNLLKLGIPDENIDKLYMINAPISREVWYYVLIKVMEEKKLADFLNILLGKFGDIALGNLSSQLNALSLEYDGEFRTKIFNIAVLVSGRGTNLQAIIDAINKGIINGRISIVISNKKNAKAIERAKKHDIKWAYVPLNKGESREEYDRKMSKIIDENDVNLIVLAGFLRVLSPWFVNKYSGKIINVHPSLLPAFAGLWGIDVHRKVIEYGAKVSGCTVHFVDEEVDHGPIIIQKCVTVNDDDTPETLADKILIKEHEAIVEAIKLISKGRVRIEGRKVIIKK